MKYYKVIYTINNLEKREIYLNRNSILECELVLTDSFKHNILDKLIKINSINEI